MLGRKLSLKAALRSIHGEDPQTSDDEIRPPDPRDDGRLAAIAEKTPALEAATADAPDEHALLADLEAFPHLTPPAGMSPLSEQEVAAEWRVFEAELKRLQKSGEIDPAPGLEGIKPEIRRVVADPDEPSRVGHEPKRSPQVASAFIYGFAAAALLCGLLTMVWTLSSRWAVPAYSPITQELFPQNTMVFRSGSDVPLVSVPAEHEVFILSLGSVGFNDRADLSVKLFDEGGKRLHSATNLISRNGMLTLFLPTAPLEPGGYELRLFAAEEAQPTAHYRFRLEFSASE